MKKRDVRIGATYSAKISGRVVPVTLLEVAGSGWKARNETTGRVVRIKSAAKLREELSAAPKPPVDPTRTTAKELNTLRTQRLHLSAQIEAGIDTPHATLDAARMHLADVEGRIAAAEDELRDVPEAAHLFQRPRKRNAKPSVQSLPDMATYDQAKSNDQGDDMAAKTKAEKLQDVLESLRKAEKRAGSTKWALSGAGAKKNPPSKERKAALEAKLAEEQETIARLREQRDKLAPKKTA